MVLPPWLPISTLIKGAAIFAILVSFFTLGFTANNQIWSKRWAERNERDMAHALEVSNKITELEQALRQQEHKLQIEKQKVEEEYATKVNTLSSALSTVTSSNRRMRDLIATYSSAGGTSPDSSASCTNNDRAKTLGLLLAEASDLATEGLSDAARYSEQIIALKSYIRRVCFNAFNTPKVVPSGN